MKTTAATISVNPGRKTVGYLHPECAADFMKKAAGAIPSASVKLPRKKTLNGFFFATSTPGDRVYGKRMLAFRIVWSLLLAACAFHAPAPGLNMSEYGVNTSAISALLGIASVMGFLGILERPVAWFAALWFGILAAFAIASGSLPMEQLSLTALSAYMAVSGPGKYSCDFLIRKSIYRRVLSNRRKEKDDRLTYRAFSKMA